MQRRRQTRRFPGLRLQALLLRLQSLKFGENIWAGLAVGDRIHEVGYLALDGREVSLAGIGLRGHLRGQLLPFGIERRDELRDQFRPHELPAQGLHHVCGQMGAPDRRGVPTSGVLGGLAAEVVLASDR